MKIEEHFSNNQNRFMGVNSRKFITIHQTGNTKKGANALNHVKYINNGSTATWHYTVDSERVVQHFNDSIQCWHCGDGKGDGNTKSIGVELCVNSDGNYISTIHNAIELVKHLMKKHNIPVENVVQHNRWSGKNCPTQIRDGLHGITWNVFKSYLDVPSNVLPSSSSDIHKIAKDVISGKYGNGEQRKKSLGSSFHIVQKEVNRILQGG